MRDEEGKEKKEKEKDGGAEEKRSKDSAAEVIFEDIIIKNFFLMDGRL